MAWCNGGYGGPISTYTNKDGWDCRWISSHQPGTGFSLRRVVSSVNRKSTSTFRVFIVTYVTTTPWNTLFRVGKRLLSNDVWVTFCSMKNAHRHLTNPILKLTRAPRYWGFNVTATWQQDCFHLQGCKKSCTLTRPSVLMAHTQRNIIVHGGAYGVTPLFFWEPLFLWREFWDHPHQKYVCEYLVLLKKNAGVFK